MVCTQGSLARLAHNTRIAEHARTIEPANVVRTSAAVHARIRVALQDFCNELCDELQNISE
jgi:hypothetical protein